MVQQVGRDTELVVTACCDILLERFEKRNAVLAHQTPHTAAGNAQADTLQLFGYPLAAVAA